MAGAKPKRWVWFVAVLLFTVFSSTSVSAQSQAELNAARNAFREGLSLEAAGNWGLALKKFEEVAAVKLTPQVRFHMARCKEHLGRLNEALGEYRMAEYEAQQQELQEAEAIQAAREQLEERIPRLKITRAPGAEQSRVKLDGVQLGEASLAETITVDPGPHQLEAVSLQGQRFETQFMAEENKTADVTIEFDASAAVEPEAEVGNEPVAMESAVEADTPLFPLLIGGVGVAALGGSVFALLQAGDAADEQRELEQRIGDRCVGNECSEEVRSEVLKLEDAQAEEKTFSAIGFSGLAVSALALGAATYLWLDSGSEPEAAVATRWVVTALPGDARISFQGSF